MISKEYSYEKDMQVKQEEARQGVRKEIAISIDRNGNVT